MSNNSLFNAIDELQAYRDRYTTTDNGALTLASTGSKVLDFFSRAGSMRKEVLESIEASKGRKAKRKISNISFESQLINTELYKLFNNAYLEDAKLTLLVLFNLRDVRERLVDLYNKTPNKTHIAILNEDGDIEYVDNNGNKVEF